MPRPSAVGNQTAWNLAQRIIGTERCGDRDCRHRVRGRSPAAGDHVHANFCPPMWQDCNRPPRALPRRQRIRTVLDSLVNLPPPAKLAHCGDTHSARTLSASCSRWESGVLQRSPALRPYKWPVTVYPCHGKDAITFPIVVIFRFKIGGWEFLCRS